MINFSIDSKKQFLGVGVQAFDRLGLEDSLPNYRIVSVQRDRGIDAVQPANARITALTDINNDLSGNLKTTKKIVSSEEFKQIISQYYSDDQELFLLAYKGTVGVEKAAQNLGLNLLANTFKLRKEIENKVSFREMFASSVPVPKHFIYSKEELQTHEHDRIAKHFLPYVMQDETLSGGKGTFIVHDRSDFEIALQTLSDKGGNKIVVSEFIAGTDISIQGCTTDYGTFHGPLQEQIIDDPLLINTDFPWREKFCGGKWGYLTVKDATEKQAREITGRIGSMLRQQGYRGIFGIDFRMTANLQLYVLEINPRLTGLTSPLTMLQQSVSPASLLLLHVLELAGIPYSLDKPEELQNAFSKTSRLTYAILHNTKNIPVRVNNSLTGGLYNNVESSLVYSHPGYSVKHFNASPQTLIASLPNTGTVIKTGERIARILTVSEDIKSAVSFIESHYLKA